MLQARYLAFDHPPDRVLDVFGWGLDNNNPQLKEEMIPEYHSLRLISVASPQKGLIHKYIDKHRRLRRLFASVCVSFQSLHCS